METTTAPVFMAVGKNCASDFLGDDDAASVLDVYEHLLNGFAALDGDDWSGGGNGRVSSFDLRSFLITTCTHIRVDGWLSRTNARKLFREGQATADAVVAQLCEKDSSKIDAVYRTPTDADIARADSAIEFMTKFLAETDSDNDYLHNLGVILRLGYVNFKTSGISASLITTAETEMGKEIERRKFLDLKRTSKHLGVVGESLRVRAWVRSVREIEGAYGVVNVINFVTEDESALTWFASGNVGDDWRKDGVFTIEGKVKKHEIYQDMKQTVLTRVVALSDAYLAEEKAKLEKKAQRQAKKAAKLAKSAAS